MRNQCKPNEIPCADVFIRKTSTGGYFTPNGSLAPNTYDVALFLNGNRIAFELGITASDWPLIAADRLAGSHGLNRRGDRTYVQEVKEGAWRTFLPTWAGGTVVSPRQIIFGAEAAA